MKAAAPFSVIYEDDDIIAVNKASGISVGGDRWDESKERLDHMVSLVCLCQKLFTVHRIDRETSGLVLFAKNEAAHRSLSLAFEGRDVFKRYIAIVCGRPSWQETICDLPLIPNGNKQHLTIVDKYKGKKSLTRFTRICSAGNLSIVEAFPQTGRTHQIRVHAAALGYPVACDSLYANQRFANQRFDNLNRRSGSVAPVMLSAIKRNWRGDPFDEKPLLARLALHAAEIIIPVVNDSNKNQNRLSIQAPVPKDMAALIRQMERLK